MTTRFIVIACIVFAASPALADQAQTDLAAALAYNQQLQQQQQQQTQMQNQQFALGTAGVQPYCNYYGTCPTSLAAPQAPNSGWGVLGLLFGSAPQPAPAAYPATGDEDMTPPTPARHHRRHHRIHQ